MEETWELAALMNRASASIVLIGLSACMVLYLVHDGMAESSELSNLRATVVKTHVDIPSFDEETVLSAKEADPAPEHKESINSDNINDVIRYAEPFMTPKYAQLYSVLNLTCIPTTATRWSVPLSIGVTDLTARPRKLDDGTFTVDADAGFALTGHRGLFWQRGDVYFDEVKTVVPSIYKTIEKKISTGPNSYETRKERILVGPESAYYDVLLPKLKASKTMRLHYHYGTGPTFDLTNIKSDIERLEAQCAPKDANK